MVKTIILLYHDIDSFDAPSEKTDLATKETVVRIEEFEGHMEFLARAGYRVLSIRQFLNALQAGELAENDIVLTFDDGHISNYQFALPILRGYSFSATFFIIADNIGRPFYMGEPEIKELLAHNMEIGSHGKTHAYLPKLTSEEIRCELIESKTILETCTQGTIDVFAYPGGHFTPQIVKYVKDAGYRATASCISGRNTRKTDPFLLRRIEIRRGTSAQAFQHALQPTNIMFSQIIDRGKTFLKRGVGLDRYERLRENLYFLYPFKR